MSPKNQLIVPNQGRKPEESHTTALSNENSVTHEQLTVAKDGEAKTINLNVANMDP